MRQRHGGTSALLRHLKTIHPAAINFDPENPPPVARRKRRKIEDYTIVTSDTTSYMDNLLGQFFQDDSAAPPPNPDTEDPGMVHVQSRADSEIDEVIRNLQKETAQSGAGDTEPDQDLRKLLGIDDMSPVRTEITAGCSVDVDEPQFPPILVLPHASPDEEKQVSSSSGSAKKRKTEDLAKSMDLPDNYKHGK
uniref:BED-type domain-containing protein n=1 Tax=Caenorhabditis japonica TaxID=281687 RepID=A0A8R1I8H1_CAEJA